ncbi:cytochrome P450 [Talaromyces proteolyticus]|uniref:Cytochrome P450 n=1 Tax=Talaromyces proteolyticus TaxID=1131652 RepID=A0AAD4Q1R8_9EURO|nr:cytochrome P450 [Talaromyces proteolyticus]KAH8698790.1 cytochrome P450 [Talaromyces proteolyticus]
MAIITTSPLELAVYGSLLLASWYLLHPLFSWNRSIPGPVLAKYTRWWYFWQLYKCDFHLTNKRLHEKHGNIVQVMPGYFTIDDPNTHKAIYSLSSPWVKGESYAAWHVGPNLHNLFSERSPVIHSTMRRKVASMYSMTSLVSYEPYVDHCIDLFESHLTGIEESNSVVDLAYWFRCYAFDVVSMITFSDRLGFLNKGQDIANLIKNVDFIRRLHTFLSVFPWVMPAVHFLRGLLAGNKQVYQQKFASEKIALKRLEPDVAEKKGPICMVKKLIDAQRTDDSKITDFDIRVTAGANVGAGSDTTAITLSCITFYIYQNPQVLQKLRDEIDGAGLARTPSFNSVQQLPYLQAVIKEATRVYPASGLPLWREVPKGGAVLSGQFFPEGTNVGVNGWVANMNKDIYGPDADEFRPERWLDAEGGRNKKFKEDTHLTFGLGTRTCIGKNVSLLEINKLIPLLVRDYDIQFVAPDGALNEDKVLAGKNIFFVRPQYLHARISKRTSGQNKN